MADQGPKGPWREKQVAEAIRDAYERFDLSMLPKLDDRLWGELAKAAMGADPVVSRSEYEELREALDAITGGRDFAVWTPIYREAGGGYEGLQAIARSALAATERRDDA